MPDIEVSNPKVNTICIEEVMPLKKSANRSLRYFLQDTQATREEKQLNFGFLRNRLDPPPLYP